MGKVKLQEILLSDSNIYKAILSINSYIYDLQLMDDDDIELYYQLQDKFNYEKYFGKDNHSNGFIEEIREIIKNVINHRDELFSTKVYFKIKKPKEGIYRPLHVSNLKESIAMVAMLQVLIFDMELSNDTKMRLSNLAKILPSNFYGNIPSRSPEQLFEKWQVKYKEYSEIANEKFAEYENSEKYKFEITLDLKIFFPSINPILVYKKIIESLRVRFSNEDFELIKIITFKLLYLKIEAYNDEQYKFFKKLYYTENDNYEEIKVNIGGINNYITKGVPQGLPQSYFFGNLIMVNVAQIYDEVFKGESIYYVDDSYLYTNIDVNGDCFTNILEELNEKLEKYSLDIIKEEKKLEIPNGEYLQVFENFYNRKNYVIKVHTGDKSSYLSVKDNKTGYKYLKYLSRLASMGSFDFNTVFSDFEEIQIKEKFDVLIEVIKEEIELHCGIIQAKNKCLNGNTKDHYKRCIDCRNRCAKFEKYEEYFNKLKRFKKFFQYRVLIMEMRESDEAIKEISEELLKLDENKLEDDFDNNLFEIKLSLLVQYLLDSVEYIPNTEYSSNTLKLSKRENEIQDRIKVISEKIKKFELYYSKKSEIENEECNYDYFYYHKLFNHYRKVNKTSNDTYSSILKIISKHINLKNKHHSYQIIYLKEVLDALQKNIIVEYAFGTQIIEFKYNEEKGEKYNILVNWCKRSRFLQKYIMNTIVSVILNIELNNNLYISRSDKKPLNYFELRLAIAARNNKISLTLIAQILEEYINAKKYRNLDYGVFEAIYYFRVFAREPEYIDNLILIHKYTTELWENGSKYLHFYTLHNQSHAVELIKNINIFIKSIDYLKISKIDYYILYIACYLHDISMVLYPNQDRFLNKEWKDSNLIYMDFMKKVKSTNLYNNYEQQNIKSLLLEMYKKIDNLFENEIRNNHAESSSHFIRASKELAFIDQAILEIVAEISYSHGMDTRDVYYLKSSAKNHLISKKFMMILIRLADLFDMSKNRVSLPIFYNNKANMSKTTKFHWISHLITDDFKVENKYNFDKIDIKEIDVDKIYTDMSYFKPETIKELITINISVNLDQLTTIKNEEKCSMICMKRYSGENTIELDIQEKGEENQCEERCNFICKWFTKKNEYMIYELYYLQEYMSHVQNYFKTSFQINLDLKDRNIIRSEDFDDLKNYIQ